MRWFFAAASGKGTLASLGWKCLLAAGERLLTEVSLGKSKRDDDHYL